MEIRARYVQMGAFTLAVIAAGFAFVYWLNNAGGLRERTVYRIRFESPVSGLLQGSAVLFNGIRVGEVTALDAQQPPTRGRCWRPSPSSAATPVRTDTTVGIDFQGLTGSPVDRADGRHLDRAARRRQGRTAPARRRSRGQPEHVAGRRARCCAASTPCSPRMPQPLRKTIANLDTFSGALARNSDRLDGIVAGLERMTGGAAAKARTAVYDLALPPIPRAERKASGAQLVDARPLGARGPRQRQDPERHAGRRQRGAARCAMERHAVEAACR